MVEGQLIENRAVNSGVPVLNDRTLSGTWMVFNEMSQPLLGKMGDRMVIFREIIEDRAMDGCDLTNTKCCLNHDESKFLGRVPNTLRIDRNDRGMTYECDLPILPVGDEAIQYTNRGDYAGNSFRFITMKGDDVWERGADGMFIRRVKKIRAIVHLGPVFDPAYPQTDLQAAMRSLADSGILEIEKEEIKEMNFAAARNRSLALK